MYKRQALDISDWQMPTAANRTNMLYGLDRLATLVLGNGARLDGTGLGLSLIHIFRGPHGLGHALQLQ